MVLPSTDWCFQVLTGAPYLWQAEAPKKVFWSTFFLRVYFIKTHVLLLQQCYSNSLEVFFGDKRHIHTNGQATKNTITALYSLKENLHCSNMNMDFMKKQQGQMLWGKGMWRNRYKEPDAISGACYIVIELHSKKKCTSKHLFWCFRLSQIGLYSVHVPGMTKWYLEGPW